jgi:hypothetical protein
MEASAADTPAATVASSSWGVFLMSGAEYASTRTDDRTHIGGAIKRIIALIIEEGLSWQRAADIVGVKRTRAYKALHKGHVIQYRRRKKREEDELNAAGIGHYLRKVMTESENDAARVRAALALQQIGEEARAEPGAGRHLTQNGIVIYIGAPQRSLPPGAPMIEMAPLTEGEHVRSDSDL